MIRKAIISDAKNIKRLIDIYASRELMLSRAIQEIYSNIRDYWVVGVDSYSIRGCVALHVCWEDLAEVKSLAVAEYAQKTGLGKQLVLKTLEEAKDMGIKRVFALSYVPDFFVKLGFQIIDKSELPHKIWSECIKCSKFPDCDETALAIDIEI